MPAKCTYTIKYMYYLSSFLSRLKLVGLDALPTYKRVVAWFPGPAEDVERYLLRLHRLNQGLDTRHWRVYQRKEESNGVQLVLSIDMASLQCWRG